MADDLQALAVRAAGLAARDDETAERAVLGITGPPGAGKSTLGERLAQAVAALGIPVVRVPMDGFHLANAELVRLGRRDRKGAIDTFDVDGYAALLRRARTVRARTVSQLGVLPTTEVVQLVEPLVRLSDRLVVGATAATSGATVCEASAVASETVSVDAEPDPPRTPELLVVLPGVTTNRLVPSALISEVTCA